MMGAMTDIDYDKVFAPYMEKIKGREMPRSPGRGEAFARAFGSREGGSSVMGEIAQAREAREKRETDLMATERDLLEAKLTQERGKGEATKALKTLEQQKLLETKLADIADRKRIQREDEKREKDEEAWKRKQKFLFGERSTLEGVKAGHAQRLIKARVDAVAKAKGIDPNVLLKLTSEPMLLRLKAKYAHDPALPFDTEDPELEQEINDFVLQKAIEYQSQFGPNAGSAPSTPPAPAKSRARLRAEEIAASRKKGK
jgi:hypothetical protein